MCGPWPMTQTQRVLVGAVVAAAAVTIILSAPSVAGVLSRPGGPVDPTTTACARVGGRCDPAAEAARVAANREAQPPTGVVLPRANVEALARGLAKTPLTPDAAIGATVYSALTSRPQFEALSHEAHNYSVNADRAVWVVTVHAQMATSGTPAQPPTVFDVYSVALDAETGQWTDYCVGCEWLTTSK